MGVVLVLVLGAIASLIALAVSKGPAALRSRRVHRRTWLDVSNRARRAGVTSFIFSRDDYKERLPVYLDHADFSIEIVSISLNATSNEGQLLQLLERKLRSRDDFRVDISLLAPRCRALDPAAFALAMTREELATEIREMMRALVKLRGDLDERTRQRLRILKHETLPAASAIMLDARQDSGRIQIETKLYRAPRTESFGYEVCGPGEFYERNYRAYRLIIADSRSIVARDLDP